MRLCGLGWYKLCSCTLKIIKKIFKWWKVADIYIYMPQKEEKKRKKLQILMMNSLINKQLKNLVKEFIIRICSCSFIFYFLSVAYIYNYALYSCVLLDL